MKRLMDKIAIITGAAQGMGAETARLFAEEGASVCLTDTRHTVHALAEDIGSHAVAFRHDVSMEADWLHISSEVWQRFGKIDVLINNAGIFTVSGPLLETEKADWTKMFDINLYGAWLGMKYIAPLMAHGGRGSIVNIASISALRGFENIAPYSVSKWALRGLSKNAAVELGSAGIRVNTIFPGTIDTEMGRLGNPTEEELSARFRSQPIQRIGSTLDIAQASLFLASDESS